MELRFEQDRIEALMGEHVPEGVDDWRVAAHVIDGILDNDDHNRGGFASWTVDLAVETYVDGDFFARERMDADNIEWGDVTNAVSAALAALSAAVNTNLRAQHEDVVSVIVAHDAGDAAVVWMTAEGQRRYGTEAVEITFWPDGYHLAFERTDGTVGEVEFAPGGPEDRRIGVRFARENPASVALDAIVSEEMAA